MKNTTPNERYEIIKAQCERETLAILLDLHLPAEHAVDIEGRLVVHMLKVAEKYRAGALSFKSYCWRHCLNLGINMREFYRADKRRELLNRVQEDEKEEADGNVSWVERLVVTPSKAMFITDFRERCSKLTSDERAVLNELEAGITERESSFEPNKRRRLHESLREKFADLKIFLTQDGNCAE